MHSFSRSLISLFLFGPCEVLEEPMRVDIVSYFTPSILLIDPLLMHLTIQLSQAIQESALTSALPRVGAMAMALVVVLQ